MGVPKMRPQQAIDKPEYTHAKDHHELPVTAEHILKQQGRQSGHRRLKHHRDQILNGMHPKSGRWRQHLGGMMHLVE